MSSKSPGPGGTKRKQLIVRVLMLDDTSVPFQIESKATGFELTSLVYQYLKLVESDYFGLEYIDAKGKKCWLDHDKPASRQVANNATLFFCVKFYTPDPGQLEEEYTRYLFALQVKRDLAQGVLMCSDATASLLASYILQAELGDYSTSYNDNTIYFINRKFFPHQNEDHDLKIIDYHKNHVGQTSAEADLNLLDIARKTELYGILMRPARDHEGVQLNLAVANMGILVFQHFTKINTFSWAKIRKLSFKRKKFLIKLHPENYGFYKDTVEFYFENRNDSKNFWKKCIENHSFFRCVSTDRMPRQKSRLLSRGSSFRYYGRTQKELIETAREQFGKHRPFDRSYHSMRSISQFASGGQNAANSAANSSNYANANGTQSLNRNMASRSTGALQTNGGLNSSGPDSAGNLIQQYNGGVGANSNSAHHLSYIVNGSQPPFGGGGKSATLQSQRSIDHQQFNASSNGVSHSGRSSVPAMHSQHMHHMHQRNDDDEDDEVYRGGSGGEDDEENELEDEEEQQHQQMLLRQQKLMYQQQYLQQQQQQQQQQRGGANRNANFRSQHDDSSTHGSRTIDSRYSRNNGGLGLSDNDEADRCEDDDNDEDDEDNESEELEGEDEGEDGGEDEPQQKQQQGVNDEEAEDEGEMMYQHQQKCTCGQPHESSPNNHANNYVQLKAASNNNTNGLKSGIRSTPTTATVVAAVSSGAGSSLFRNLSKPQPVKSAPPPQLISLPIQQQQQQSVQNQSNLRPSTLKKIEMQPTATITADINGNNFMPAASANALALATAAAAAAVNPNKIISRKEVITTYKEETKNTLLEECYQTTTFYDNPANNNNNNNNNNLALPASSTSKSSNANNNHQSSPNNFNNNKSSPAAAATAVSAPPLTKTLTTTTMTTKNTMINVISDFEEDENNRDANAISTVLQLHQQQPQDDEATKNDRCSLAAKIIYSNLYRQSNNSGCSSPNGSGNGMNRPNFERIKRPITLAKQSIVASSPFSTFTEDLANGGKQISIYSSLSSKPVKPVTAPKPIYIKQQIHNDTSDDQFPLPPPPPVVLEEYQEPKGGQHNLHQQPNSKPKVIPPTPFFNIEDEFKRKRTPLEESYCIVKEIVMTERTYKKDLELLTHTFRQFAVTNNFDLSELLFFEQLLYPQAFEPIHDFHSHFLKELEIRLFYWTDKTSTDDNSNSSNNSHRIGDLLGRLSSILKHYRSYVDRYEEVLCELDAACKHNRKFDALFKDFEAQKVCYLPFTMFLIKPIQRIIHYKLLFERLLIYYGPKHRDYADTYAIFAQVEDLYELVAEKLPLIENKQKLMELQRDLVGVDSFFAAATSPRSTANKYFVREGSLQKLSRKGYQQRMFFLFNDVLLYCARSSNPVLQFKVHGEYQLRHMQIEDGNPHINIPNSFTIYSANRSLLIAAVSADEKAKWLQNLYESIEKCRNSGEDRAYYSSLKSNSSSDNNLDQPSREEENASAAEQVTEFSNNPEQTSSVSASSSHQQHRANTTMHVCWHRNTSVGISDIHKSIVNHMSGYLLRKFKNSNGWQKLWVVFTNFCLFFYKTYQDEFPLASLPLLGYTIAVPNEADNISKDYVFKLQFKNHVYFFRAESQYTFDRWLEVIESAAQKQCMLDINY